MFRTIALLLVFLFAACQGELDDPGYWTVNFSSEPCRMVQPGFTACIGYDGRFIQYDPPGATPTQEVLTPTPTSTPEPGCTDGFYYGRTTVRLNFRNEPTILDNRGRNTLLFTIPTNAQVEVDRCVSKSYPGWLYVYFEGRDTAGVLHVRTSGFVSAQFVQPEAG